MSSNTAALARPTSAKPTQPVKPAKKHLTPRKVIARTAFYVLMAVIAIPFLFPVYWMFVTAIKPLGQVFANPPVLWPESPQWQNFIVPFTSGPFLQQFFNSTYIATVSTIGVLAVSSLAGYAFARITFPGRSGIFIVLLSALLIPAEVTIIPMFKLMSTLGWIDNHLSLIIPAIFGAPCVLGIFLMRQFFLALPDELEQSARLDGLNRLGMFWYIALPLARAPLAALAILAFLTSWNDFLEPLVFLRSTELWTLPLALKSFTDAATGIPIWNVQMAATTLSVVPILVVFVFAQRQFIQGIAGTGIK